MTPDKRFPTRFSRATTVAAVLAVIGAGVFMVPMIQLPERPSAWLLIENFDGQPERSVVPGTAPQHLARQKDPYCEEPPADATLADQMESGCWTVRILPCDEGFQTAWTRGTLAKNYLTCIDETLSRDLGREPSFAFEIGLAWMEVRHLGRALLAILWAAGILAAVGAAVAGSAYTGREILQWVQKGAQNEKPPK